MANDYKIKLEVRGRTSEFGADSVTELLVLMATELFSMDRITKPKDEQGDTVLAAKSLIEQYHQRFANTKTNRSRSQISRAGLEVDVATCYLSGKTIFQTLDFLKKEKNFKASETAVGRYWARFARLSGLAKTA